MTLSSNRIPGKYVKPSGQTVHVNDAFGGEAEVFAKSSIQREIEQSLTRVKEKERQLFEEIEEKRAQLVQEAYEEGKKMAVQEAEENLKEAYAVQMAEANSWYVKAKAYYEDLVAEAQERRDREMEIKKEELLSFALEVAKSLVHKEIDTNPEVLKSMVDHAMAQIAYETKQVYVHLHPEAMNFLMKQDAYAPHPYLTFVPSLKLEKGDILIETEREKRDHKLDTQLQLIQQAVRGAFHD